ncbi:MAG: hypothetical protein KAS32_26850 [Candidatus Peribacteraceae bacterium]|nr:hypothetical protein [Candidatus Peribacteraceae bacterium]
MYASEMYITAATLDEGVITSKIASIIKKIKSAKDAKEAANLKASLASLRRTHRIATAGSYSKLSTAYA